ncbi:unannotated protein [freshwater metagenome]|uniref:Unannotated protein n=1 Tax=freshwater metagenome TaxID=449393 RepID=A0A6J7GJ67_9ZZZZ
MKNSPLASPNIVSVSPRSALIVSLANPMFVRST